VNKTLTESDILALLAKKYSPPAYAFLPQVRNGTGYLSKTTTCDALVIGTWPSRGLYLEGFEIKTHRSDWIKELNTPEKAEEIASFCDFWWLLINEEGVAKTEELPHNWGLMVTMGKRGLTIRKQAVQLKPEPIDRLFLASIFRNSNNNMVPKDRIEPIIKWRIEKALKNQEGSIQWEREELKRLEKAVEVFEKESGVTISKWGYGNIGQAVKLALSSPEGRAYERMRDAKKSLENVIKVLDEELKPSQTEIFKEATHA